MAENEFPKQEGLTVEFKQAWGDTAKKTLIAFANTAGGELFFGIDDAGRPVGITESFDALARCVTRFCRCGVEPPMVGLVSFQELSIAHKRIFKVCVVPGSDRPYGFHNNRLTTAYLRVGSSSELATSEELMQLIRENNPVAWEDRLCVEDNLTFNELTAVFEQQGIGLLPAHWVTLGLRSKYGHWTNLGLLLSDQNPRVIRLNFISDGTVKRGIDCRGSLLRQVQEILRTLDSLNETTIRKTGKLESERFRAWPPEAIREALVNCAAHRDYSIETPTVISPKDTMIEFLSFGTIPDGLGVDDIVLAGVGRCRNSKLSALLQRLGWMESLGSGLPDILKAYEGSNAAPEIQSNQRMFVIRLPRIDDGFVAKPRERLLRLFEQKPERTARELAEALGMSRAFVTMALGELVQAGKVKRIGNGRSVRYQLSGEFGKKHL